MQAVAPSGNSGNSGNSGTPSLPPLPTFFFEVVSVDGRGKVTGREQRQATYQPVDLGQGVTLEMVGVPGGRFQMGSPADEGRDYERPQHEVSVGPFWLGKYLVTQAQWRAVSALPRVKADLPTAPSKFSGENKPIELVSWNEAVEFCHRLSRSTGQTYRLPSEAEWEYACRAGTTTPFHFGETITTDLANYRGTGWNLGDITYSGNYGAGPKGEYREKTTEVGSFPANAFGLYDMHGNVWEWCQDHWHDNYAGAPTDGSAWLSANEGANRLLRGGSWSNYPGSCRSAYRGRLARDLRHLVVGFRVVCVFS